MFFMEYVVWLLLVLVVFSVVVLGFVVVPYHGVICLMASSFLCCAVMVLMGRTYVALVMYIVYLGGLIVVFGYCVSVEKGGGVKGVGGSWYVGVMVGVVVVVGVLGLVFGGVQGLIGYDNWEGWVSLEINGCGVFYSFGGVGLMVCAWGLVVALFSILVILGWGGKGGVRPF